MPALGTKVIALRVKEKTHSKLYEIASKHKTTPARILNALLLEDSDKSGAALTIAVGYLDKLYGENYESDDDTGADTD